MKYEFFLRNNKLRVNFSHTFTNLCIVLLLCST